MQGSADLIVQYLREAALVNADESDLRVAGKLHWLHIMLEVLQRPFAGIAIQSAA